MDPTNFSQPKNTKEPSFGSTEKEREFGYLGFWPFKKNKKIINLKQWGGKIETDEGKKEREKEEKKKFLFLLDESWFSFVWYVIFFCLFCLSYEDLSIWVLVLLGLLQLRTANLRPHAILLFQLSWVVGLCNCGHTTGQSLE